MNEVSLPPRGPITGPVVGNLATVGGARAATANQLPADWRLLYRIFQLFFIHKKRDRGKVRKGGEKKTTSIHKNLPWHESPDMFFFLCPLELKELHFVYPISRLRL